MEDASDFKMKKIWILGILFLLNLFLLSALTIENTTFKTSVQNYTIYVNGSISLDKVIITNSTIEFYNLSDGGRFDNTNETYVSIVSFYGINSTKNDVRYENGTIIHNVTDRNISIPSDSYIEIGDSDMDYVCALPSGIIRFLNCSPDWVHYPSKPNEQTSTIAAINATNNGTLQEDFQIKYTGSINSGWILFACNDSSETDPDNDGDCITLNTSFQIIWGDIAANDEKRVWLYGNCSNVSANPGVSIDMQVI